LCLEFKSTDPSQGLHWHWKVKTALDALRDQLKLVLVPGSHICVDEAALKFHGRKKDKVKIPHKPAKEGFICYALASHGGLIHDFIVASSQHGLEGIPTGITISTTTRELRKRKRSSTGISATEIHLPPIKSAVYLLCERVTKQQRDKAFICYIDNLFVDVHLAQALLSIGIGICGTTRKNAPSVPPILLAIQHRFPHLLADNACISLPAKDLVNCFIWHDSLRDNIVSFISTVHLSNAWRLVTRRYKHQHSIRTTLKGFERV
jgi:hypothetical protein